MPQSALGDALAGAPIQRRFQLRRPRRRSATGPKRHSAPASPGNAPAARSLSWSHAPPGRSGPARSRGRLRRLAIAAEAASTPYRVDSPPPRVKGHQSGMPQMERVAVVDRRSGSGWRSARDAPWIAPIAVFHHWRLESRLSGKEYGAATVPTIGRRRVLPNSFAKVIEEPEPEQRAHPPAPRAAAISVWRR